MDIGILKWANMARIDFKNMGEGNNIKITVLEGERCNISAPNWFSKGGIGYVLETDETHLLLELQCLGKGELLINLTSVDRRTSDGKRLRLCVDYTQLVVNGKPDFHGIKTQCNNSYSFRKSVENGEKVAVEISWKAHRGNLVELQRILYSRKNYALITGAIRNEFYLRVALIKLCDMREKGVIKEIVLSTWRGEVDRFGDLRECLEKLNIIVLECNYIDEKAEAKYNQIGFQVQRTLIAAGLDVIPNDCFVFKLRTDFLAGINPVIDLIENEVDLTLDDYGKFPHIFDYKILMKIHSMNRLTFANDRFIYGYKPDLEKMYIPVMNRVDRKFFLYADHELTFGFCYLSYPLLKCTWNILSLGLFPMFVDYCRKSNECELKLPRLFLRIFALNIVYLYTHVNIATNSNNMPSDCKPVSLIDLFSNRILNNDDIRKIIHGNVKDKESRLAVVFYDELRKIALNDYSTRGYTREEYDELKKFIVEELQADPRLFGSYPFKESNNEYDADKEVSSKILLDKYHDDKFTADVMLNIGEKFEMFSDMYKRVHSSRENMEIILKAAVCDASISIIKTYMEYLANCIEFFDYFTWGQALRYMKRASVSHNKDLIIAIYYSIVAYMKISMVEQSIMQTKSNVEEIAIASIKSFGGKVSYGVRNQSDYLISIVRLMNLSSDKDKLDNNDMILVEALLEINPDENPFSPELIKKIGDEEISHEIINLYSNKIYNSDKWILDDSLQ